MILRDKDASNDWDEVAAASTPGQRYDSCQNWRGDVVAIVKSTGSQVVEWVKYLAYGRPDLHPFSDADGDGTVGLSDSAVFVNMYTAAGTSYFVRADTDLSGTRTSADLTAFSTDINTWPNAGVGELSRTDATFNVGNRMGYAGMQWDPIIHKYLARNRWMDPETGDWLSRDMLGYVDESPNLQLYVDGRAIEAVDPSGLVSRRVIGTDEPLFDPGTPGPWPECPPGWYFNRYVNKCVPVSPTIHYSPPKNQPPGNEVGPEEDLCAWACDQGPAAYGAVVCYRGSPVVCNCTKRRFRGTWNKPYAQSLSECINSCEPAHIPNMNCGANGGQGAWVDGERGRVCSECAVNTCVRDCYASFNCGGDVACEFIKRMLDSNKDLWCKKCDAARR